MTSTDVSMVDRRSPVPLYFQLARLLADEIQDVDRPSGLRLSSEAEIGERFGVSRATVRQALQRLENEGLIQRFKGRGTFVADARDRSWLLQSPQGLFHDELDRLGINVTSKVLSGRLARLPRWAAGSLALPSGSRGYILERLRYVDGGAATHVTDYLPAAYADAATALKRKQGSLYDELEHLGATVFGGRRTLEAAHAEPPVAKLLEVGPRTALLFVESVAWDAQMRPFHCYQAWVRTDRIKIEIEVSRSASPLPAIGADVGREPAIAPSVA